jgi:NADPH:quinone reductase-like Zn-dependent oxidoreductase
MKAARLQAYGDVTQFKHEHVPDPKPGPGEVLIKVVASAVNHIDLYARQGFVHQYYPMEHPAILGADGAGTVVALGPGVTGFAAGDRVVAHFPINGRGAHAELAVAPVKGLAKLPANVSFEQGATLPLAGLTGRQAVDALKVKRGARVLVSGALGAVGRVAVQYLKEIGAKPVAGVRPAHLKEGQALAGEAVDITKTAAAPGFDHAISASAQQAGNAIKHVRDGGTLASVVMTPEGANAGERIKIVAVSGTDDPAMLQNVVNAAGRGELKIPIAKTYKLSELDKAHTAMAAGSAGKVVLVH